MPRTLALAVFLSMLVALSACGGSNGPRPTSPFTAQDALAFDDAVDLVDDPDVLEGRWYDDWATEIVNRVTGADSVLVVTVNAVREDTTPDSKRSFRLQTSTERSLQGPRVDDLTFVVTEQEAGYDSVSTNQARILARSFVAFVKWKAEGDGVVARWHLSPASTAVVQTVTNTVRNRDQLESMRPASSR